MTTEIRKDSEHLTVFPPTLEGGFTQEEKDRLAMLVRKEISETERTRYNHEVTITINKQKPKLEDEEKEAKRQNLIEQHVKVVEMFTRHIEVLETLLKKLDTNNNG
jgi:hypothetical protein